MYSTLLQFPSTETGPPGPFAPAPPPPGPSVVRLWLLPSFLWEQSTILRVSCA